MNFAVIRCYLSYCTIAHLFVCYLHTIQYLYCSYFCIIHYLSAFWLLRCCSFFALYLYFALNYLMSFLTAILLPKHRFFWGISLQHCCYCIATSLLFLSYIIAIHTDFFARSLLYCYFLTILLLLTYDSTATYLVYHCYLLGILLLLTWYITATYLLYYCYLCTIRLLCLCLFGAVRVPYGYFSPKCLLWGWYCNTICMLFTC